MNKPQTLKGFRDFLPEEKRKRDWVQSRIIETFEHFGFEPTETPTLEYASLLLGKYGDEADKLVYTFEDKGKRKVGLRYDQTVPTARVLGQYQNDLPKYFRRYQIQNVFRADKPQKGRYREFTQCDIDIFGSKSHIADAEILACTYHAYKNIGFSDIHLVINDRQVLLDTLSPFATEEVTVMSIIMTIDKLDKISEADAATELVAKGLTQTAAEEAISSLKNAQPTETLQKILFTIDKLGVPTDNFGFNPYIARGLDYYTGMIFEVQSKDYNENGLSLGGGGRYDNLIEELTGQSIAAVGMAFGFDRTVEAADHFGLISTTQSSSQALVSIFDQAFLDQSFKAASELRNAGIKTELYPEIDKLGKQFKLADQKKIPFVIIIGQNEVDENKVTLKNMQTGEQETISLAEAISMIKS